jgi:DNA-binding MarR family transcriptional regulator
MSERRLADLKQSIPALLTFVANRLSTASSTSYLRACGIGAMEFRAITTIGLEHGLRAVQIANIIGLDKSALSRTLRTLQERGFVESTLPKHSRRPVFTLTPAGREVQRAGAAIADQLQVLLLEGVGEADRRLLVRVLNDLLENAGKMQAFSQSLPVAADVSKAPKRRTRTKTGQKIVSSPGARTRRPQQAG